jgi:hypothetical protein
MGSQGNPEGERLSDGFGVVPQLEEIGRRIRDYAALGYLDDLTDTRGPREYFAAAFALYLTEPQSLNVADPHIYRLLRNSVLSESFWNRIAPSLPSAT